MMFLRQGKNRVAGALLFLILNHFFFNGWVFHSKLIIKCGSISILKESRSGIYRAEMMLETQLKIGFGNNHGVRFAPYI